MEWDTGGVGKCKGQVRQRLTQKLRYNKDGEQPIHNKDGDSKPLVERLGLAPKILAVEYNACTTKPECECKNIV